MSILTNNLNLPSSIVRAVARDPYTKGDAHISVTGLIGPARKRALEIRHANEITEDVADRIWSLMGQIAHGILERADHEGWTEERLFIERHGWRISGQFDRVVLEDGTLQDYKLTSSYSIKDGNKPEWTAQLNLYRLMLQEHGYTVRRLQTVVILRDYQRSKARNNPDYPQAPVAVVDSPLWSIDETEAFLSARLAAHGHAQHVLPECSPDERWARPPAFALWKDGNQRATRIFDTADAAETALAEAQAKRPKDSFSIVATPEKSVRCADYCTVAQFCEQHIKASTNSLGLAK